MAIFMLSAKKFIYSNLSIFGFFPSKKHNSFGLRPQKIAVILKTGYNFRFLMYKTGTARMARQGMEGKICRAPKARGV